MTPPALEAYRASARSWLAASAPPPLPQDYRLRTEALREWHSTLYRSGWVGIDWPRELGGQGLSLEHALIFIEESARAGAPQPFGAIGLHVVGPTLLRYGTGEQLARFVEPLLSGKEIWCQGFSEPDAGSDLASLRTRAVLEDDEFVLTGQKIWTSWADDSDWCAVLARTDPDRAQHKGISYLLVDMKTPGVTVRPITQITGDAEFCEVFFEDVRVPRSNLLGPLHGGWELAMHTLGHERSGYALRRRAELEVSYRNLLDAIRLGDSGPDVAVRIGAAYVTLRGLSALSRRAVRRARNGEVPSPLDSVDKLALAKGEQQLFGTALDLLGAHRAAPLTEGTSLDGEQIVKDYLHGRAASVYGGSEQIQLTIVAERLLGLPRMR
ncbi:acyl-CoA dehydrogenase family protein [Amycolatopsis sp. GM8]|uniref:acyl-CoA dehydrogenase family protein n=1 Tax=Amycolatopsis sp. GM8 TaxID=2896530 RepID=UPI001F26F33F|nr:acyl-CoA dehydrogenase family protein [Amycolatopsis sp. GM8]